MTATLGLPDNIRQALSAGFLNSLPAGTSYAKTDNIKLTFYRPDEFSQAVTVNYYLGNKHIAWDILHF